MLPRVGGSDEVLHSSQFNHLAASESVALVLVVFVLEGSDDQVDVFFLLVLHRRVRGVGPRGEAAVLLLDAARIEKLYPLPLVLVLQLQAPQQLVAA